MKRFWLVIIAAAGLLLLGCQKTAYQRAVQAENKATPAQTQLESLPNCPTMAPKGTPEYARCQQVRLGVGGGACEGISANDKEALERCGVPPAAIQPEK